MRPSQKGLTLIELMIVVAIAIPAYQHYTARSKVTVGLNRASSARLGVAESYQSNNIKGVAAASADLKANFKATK